MTSAAEHHVRQMLLNDGALRGLCKGVTDAESRRPHEGRSSFWWIAGHLVEHRAVPLALLGGDRASPHDLSARFGRDTRPAADGGPALRDVVGEFLRFGDLLRARISELGDDAFLRFVPTPGGAELPLPHFFHFHETYHLGQLGLLRTWLGKDPLVPPRA